MFKKTLLLLLAAALCLGASGCGSSKQTEAQQNAELEKKWREQQAQKAVKYYKELVEKFPDTPQANDAKDRLQALGVPEGQTTAQK